MVFAWKSMTTRWSLAHFRKKGAVEKDQLWREWVFSEEFWYRLPQPLSSCNQIAVGQMNQARSCPGGRPQSTAIYSLRIGSTLMPYYRVRVVQGRRGSHTEANLNLRLQPTPTLYKDKQQFDMDCTCWYTTSLYIVAIIKPTLYGQKY